MTRKLMTSAVVVLLAAPAFATVEDSDGDGFYSFEEVLAAYPTVTADMFNEIDTDGDGVLTAAEMTVAEEAGLLPSEG